MARKDLLLGAVSPRVGFHRNVDDYRTEEEKMIEFLKAFVEYGTIAIASMYAKIDRRTVRSWRNESPDFEEAFQLGVEEFADRLEGEALRRSYIGVDKPVFWRGVQVGVIKEFDSKIFLKLLEVWNRDRFQTQIKIDKKVEYSQVVIKMPSNGRELADYNHFEDAQLVQDKEIPELIVKGSNNSDNSTNQANANKGS